MYKVNGQSFETGNGLDFMITRDHADEIYFPLRDGTPAYLELFSSSHTHYNGVALLGEVGAQDG